MQVTMRALAAVFFFTLLVSQLYASPPGAVYVNFIEGSVEQISADYRRAVPAKPNKALAEGETLAVTGPGNAEVFVRDGSVVRITRGGRLKVLSIERGAVQFLLESGSAYVNFKGLKGYPLFFSTPSAQVDAFDRSAFRVDMDPAGDTGVSVLAGEIYVAQPKGRMKLIVGTRLIMKKEGGTPVYTTNRPADDWDKWNGMRDREMRLPAGEKGESPRSTTYPAGPSGLAAAAAVPEVSPAPVVTHEYVYVGVGPAWGYPWYPYPYPYPWGLYPRGWWGPAYPRWGGPWPWHGGYRGHGGPPFRRHWR